MTRPKTKSELLAECVKERQALDGLLATVQAEQMLQSGFAGEWTIKDLLAHLYEWEQMLLGWIAAGERGETPGVPGDGYKWSQLPALNEAIRQKHLRRPLEEVLEMYRSSYRQISERMEAFSEEALFKPGLYAWLNTNTLAAYFTGCTSSHYRWARAEIRKGLKGKPLEIGKS